MILFSARMSEHHQKRLLKNNPEQEYVFANGIADAVQYLDQAEILVAYGSHLSEEVIERASNVKWIMALSAGMEVMPFEKVREKGIIVTNVRGIHKTQMSEYAISMLLQVYRNEKKIIENEKNHIWDKSVKVNEISGRTMLIAGAGAIGQELARMAKAFQMKTIGISRSGSRHDHFDENYTNEEIIQVLPEADFVVSVLPSTEETREFFTDEHFQAMASNAVFLNMGRGDAVRNDVIFHAIRNGEIAHAVLDVLEEEPLPDNHKFWDEERITVTPHISGMSPAYLPRSLDIFEENLKIYLSGSTDFINKLDLGKGY